jgi:hypothetical protein
MLYLNYNADEHANWQRDPAGYIKQANAKYPALLKT